MNIYIASSWKNQHAVEMLTVALEPLGHTVWSFVQKAVDTVGRENFQFHNLEAWIESEDGRKKFDYNLTSAMSANLVIYVGPSGIDAWAEVGAAYGAKVPVIGLWAKGEQVGLTRRLVSHWFRDFRDLLDFVEEKGKWLGA